MLLRLTFKYLKWAFARLSTYSHRSVVEFESELSTFTYLCSLVIELFFVLELKYDHSSSSVFSILFFLLYHFICKK